MHIGQKYGKKITIIYPGELYITSNDEYIATLLGSCISLILHDDKNMISGMNHFMLPGKITNDEKKSNETSSKYGITAIKALLVEMIKCGAEKDNLKAKIFGGGNVINLTRNQGSVSDGNIRLARMLVELEDIPIIVEDIGGHFTRKIILESKSGKCFVKKTINENMNLEK